MIVTFIDTETTGLDLLNHEVIDIAALQLSISGSDWSELTRFQAKLTPKNIESASQIALKINGYTKRKWKGSIPAKNILQVNSFYI